MELYTVENNIRNLLQKKSGAGVENYPRTRRVHLHSIGAVADWSDRCPNWTQTQSYIDNSSPSLNVALNARMQK